MLAHVQIQDHLLTLLSVEIFEYTVALPFPISAFDCDFICPSLSCGIFSDPSVSEIKRAFVSCLGALQTCRDFRIEIFNTFIRINAWRLDQTQFHGQFISTSQRSDLSKSDGLEDKKHSVLATSLDALVCQKHLAQDIKHFYICAEICRGGLVEIPHGLPADLDRNDKVAARRWIIEQNADINRQGWVKRNESELSEEYAEYLTSLVTAQKSGSCKPRSLTIDIVIHEARSKHQPLDQCGLTVHVKIKFHPSEVTIGSPKHETSQPPLPFQYCDLEPKRRLFLPLLEMQNIQGIDVKRTWTVKTHTKENEVSHSSDEDIMKTDPLRDIPMVQHFQYKTAMEFFLAAGKDLMNFRGIGITESGVKLEQIVQIQENTPHVDNAISIKQKSTTVSQSLLEGFGAEWKTG